MDVAGFFDALKAVDKTAKLEREFITHLEGNGPETIGKLYEAFKSRFISYNIFYDFIRAMHAKGHVLFGVAGVEDTLDTKVMLPR